MKIIVSIKQVPDTSGKVAVNPDGTLNRASMQTITNPDDMNALEAALKIKDATGCKVVVVTMGPPPAAGMLREALAMGADEAVLVSAREFGGSDTYATSQILAAAINKIGVEADDIVMCGRQAIDGDTAQVGPEIAEHLGLPQVTYGLEAEVDGDTVKVKKEVEEGVEVIGVKMPCLLTFTKPAWDPRYPTIKRKMAANRAEIPTLTAADLPTIDLTQAGLKGSPTKVKKTFVPQKKSGGVKIKEETAEDSAKKLFQLLSDASII